MFETLMILGLILITIAIIAMFKLSKSIDALIEYKQEEKTPTEFKRTHHSISRANFGSPLKGRSNYEKYKNENGLYEPVIGKRGIELKERKEV